MKKAYQQIASSFQARINCENSIDKHDCLPRDYVNGAKCVSCDNWREWFERHTETIKSIVKEHFPSGSGFDCGTRFEFDKSNPEKLVFFTEFHHLNENGFYDGWTQHEVIVKPSLVFGFTIRVTGKDRNDIKDYIAECFDDALNTEVA